MVKMIVEEDIEVINKLGLHARAAAKLVKLSAGYKSNIQLGNNEKMIDAKSIMGVLMLAATQGTQLTLRVEGEDAQLASEAVKQIFVNYFDEGE